MLNNFRYDLFIILTHSESSVLCISSLVRVERSCYGRNAYYLLVLPVHVLLTVIVISLCITSCPVFHMCEEDCNMMYFPVAPCHGSSRVFVTGVAKLVK